MNIKTRGEVGVKNVKKLIPENFSNLMKHVNLYNKNAMSNMINTWYTHSYTLYKNVEIQDKTF